VCPTGFKGKRGILSVNIIQRREEGVFEKKKREKKMRVLLGERGKEVHIVLEDGERKGKKGGHRPLEKKEKKIEGDQAPASGSKKKKGGKKKADFCCCRIS